jgi:hypothetical protein
MVLHLKTIEQIEELADKARNIELRFVFTKCEYLDYEVAPKPKPMTQFLPQKMKGHELNIPPEKREGDAIMKNISVKKCMPFMDVMKLGFGIPLWHHIFIRNETAYDINSIEHPESFPTKNPELYRLFHHSIKQVNNTTLDSHDMPNQIAKLGNPWAMKTPKGWSCLIVAPFHRDDIPIKIMAAVVDTDLYPEAPQFPFLCKKGFCGDVDVGTLVAQIIPFERVQKNITYSYITENEKDLKDNKKFQTLFNRKRINTYRDNYRSKER